MSLRGAKGVDSKKQRIQDLLNKAKKLTSPHQGQISSISVPQKLTQSKA
jgi:hypothetical protein